MKIKSKSKPIIWRPLSRRKKFLVYPHSWRLKNYIRFLKKKLTKHYRYQHYLRKHLLKEMLQTPYLPPHKDLDISKILQRLDVVLYQNNVVRSLSQGAHYIRRGFVSVDGQIIQDPQYFLKSGSVIKLLNTQGKNIHASLVKHPEDIIYIENNSEENKLRLLPKYVGESKEDLAWTLNMLKKR